MDDLNLLHHPFPVEEVLVFLCREVDKNAVISLNAINEYFCQLVFPELVDGFVMSGFECDTMLHSIRNYSVHRSK